MCVCVKCTISVQCQYPCQGWLAGWLGWTTRTSVALPQHQLGRSRRPAASELCAACKIGCHVETRHFRRLARHGRPLCRSESRLMLPVLMKHVSLALAASPTVPNATGTWSLSSLSFNRPRQALPNTTTSSWNWLSRCRLFPKQKASSSILRVPRLVSTVSWLHRHSRYMLRVVVRLLETGDGCSSANATRASATLVFLSPISTTQLFALLCLLVCLLALSPSLPPCELFALVHLATGPAAAWWMIGDSVPGFTLSSRVYMPGVSVSQVWPRWPCIPSVNATHARKCHKSWLRRLGSHEPAASRAWQSP